jgi:putative Mg2+ transporter-C (MgtC) family protein
MEPHTLSTGETALRLLSAAILGSLVGWDRQRKSGAAGLRTHMLVCVGSALVMIVSAFGFEDILGRPDVVLDPSRIAAQVITGIGFLGAGTILFLRQQVVRGLTTAAGLWSVAAVGLAIGSGMYVAGLLATVIILLILAVIKPLEKRVFKNERLKTILLTINIKQTSLQKIESIIKSNGLGIAEILLSKTEQQDKYQMKLTFEDKADKTSLLAIVEQLNNSTGVSGIILNAW